ncbi:MAG: DNA polymerase IV [Pseudomonadota bacterium]|nr:DNA polymerase IV [Pseudomonadota bacterium]
MPKPHSKRESKSSAITGLCRDCGIRIKCPQAVKKPTRCPKCRSPRLLFHPELFDLGIAHIDCDAFFAAIEKRDNPELEDKPVIIGGGQRGVVSTACYIARIRGVNSAMPMFKALKLCPDAVVIKPQMEKYAEAGYQIRELMKKLTPLVQPISIDEAFLDLRGTEKLHGLTPAETILNLVRNIRKNVGITVSVGLSHNKFLAKLSSDLDKPNGFTVIGQSETLDRLAPMQVEKIWGVGKAMQKRLSANGVKTIGHLQKLEEDFLLKQYGNVGQHLFRLSRGLDDRLVSPEREVKSISSETTFDKDISDTDSLSKTLWHLSEKVSRRCKKASKGGKTVVLKLKTGNFKSLTRNRTLPVSTCMAERIFSAGNELLNAELQNNPRTAYRLIGIGVTGLVEAEFADLPDLVSTDKRNLQAELAMDKIRIKFGHETILKGRSLNRRKK